MDLVRVGMPLREVYLGPRLCALDVDTWGWLESDSVSLSDGIAVERALESESRVGWVRRRNSCERRGCWRGLRKCFLETEPCSIRVERPIGACVREGKRERQTGGKYTRITTVLPVICKAPYRWPRMALKSPLEMVKFEALAKEDCRVPLLDALTVESVKDLGNVG